MCACGCFFLIAVAAALVWCAINQMWWLFGVIVVATAVAGWFGRNLANWRPAKKP
jgi:hypothetical protein